MKAFLCKLRNLLENPIAYYVIGFFTVFASFFAIELVVLSMLDVRSLTGLAFGFLWAILLAGIVLSLPRLAGRIVYGILYFPLLVWALAQTGY